MSADEQPGALVGAGIVAGSWLATAVFTTVAVLATVFEALRAAAVLVDVILFAVGCVAFLMAFAKAVDRSRHELIGVGGLYFLAGSAPPRVRAHLLGSVAAQTVVAVATAAARPFTALAFGILVPMLGLGLAGLWAARHGTFDPRPRPDVAKRRAEGSP